MAPLGAQWRCDECRKQVRGTRHRTILGRTVCTSCHDRLDSMVLGGLMAQKQGRGLPEGAVEDTTAVAGARAWLRRSIGRRRPVGSAESSLAATEPAPEDGDPTRSS